MNAFGAVQDEAVHRFLEPLTEHPVLMSSWCLEKSFGVAGRDRREMMWTPTGDTTER
jgi:hypothetical protein